MGETDRGGQTEDEEHEDADPGADAEELPEDQAAPADEGSVPDADDEGSGGDAETDTASTTAADEDGA